MLNGNNFADVLLSFGEGRVETKCDERVRDGSAVTAHKQK